MVRAVAIALAPASAFADPAIQGPQPDASGRGCLLPIGGINWLLTRPIGLIGGQVFAVANRSYLQPGSLVEASLTTGSWHTISTTLPAQVDVGELLIRPTEEVF